jgi:hypothetical protein
VHVYANCGSSIRILYPRESYDSWENLVGPVRTVCQSTMWYLVRILYPRESYDSWVDPEGPVRTVCQSTTDVVVDALASFCCHILMLMMLLFQLHVDDVDVPASCC